MKLHRLELTGFGPFRDEQTVDFDAFDRDGVFLISGRTGAGKSSILDGVSFALYGTVPRYEGGERRLRSDHSFVGDPTLVRLEFTVGERRWRVSRAPEYERPAKRGDKLTTEPARAELEERVGDVWIGRAAKPREVALALDEVLGLNAQQFQQVILLAQNKFSRFLLARNDERQQLLRTLFGTRRFEQYKDDLEQRRRLAQKELESATAEARTLLEVAENVVIDGVAAADPRPDENDVAERRRAVERMRQRAEYRVEQTVELQTQADAAHAAATTVHNERVARARVCRDLTDARDRLRGLEARSDEFANAATTLARARAAESLRAPVEAAERARRAHDAAVSDADAAARGWRDAGGADDDDFAALSDDLTGELARLDEALDREKEAAQLRVDLDREVAAVADLTGQLEAVDAHRARVPDERARLTAAHAEVAAVAARGDVAATRRDVLVSQARAADELVALAALRAKAEADYADAGAESAAAMAAVTSMLQRRLAGYAGELAAGLVAGAPCAVCGSTSHPHPAPAPEDTVTDDDLAAAEAARDSAGDRLRAAADAAAAARAAHAETAARAGGMDADTLHALVAEAEAEAQAVLDAQREQASLETRLREVDELDAEAAAAREGLVAAVGNAREALAGVQATLERVERHVAAARGDAESVAARVLATTARRDLARACLRAGQDRDECARALRSAEADRDARIAASEFVGVDDVTAALIPAAERDDLESRITAHAADLSATRARLLELELEAAGTDGAVPDVEESASALARTDAARTAAIEASQAARDTATRLRELAERIDAALSQITERADAAAVVTRLADTVAGRAPNTRKMDLETFVLAAELEEIVAAANLRLREMSSGRYTLHHSDALQARGAASGLALEVLDAHTGRLRPPQSLSGGETFLASLALALGLAEVVTGRAGGIRLDTLFVDEGFGSLDPETLESAMRTLDDLRAGGRTVGVISHVEAMKEQLPAQLLVESTPEGPSVIRQDAPVPTSSVGDEPSRLAP